MTISSTIFKNQYTGNGSNTVFAYTFKIFSEGDIAVLEGDTTKTITTDYTVSGAGNDSGGNITFVTAPANGVVVTLKRAEPLTQDIDYTENDDFPAATHEEGLDRSVIRDQTIQEQLDRALTLSEGSTVSGITFPDPTGNGEKFVRVNTAADDFEYFDIVSVGNLTVSDFGKTLVDDADAAAARTTLGLGTAATTSAADYATSAQGTTADNAQPGLDGLSIATATVAAGDGVLIQDTSDSNNLKTVTAQSIADLAAGGLSIVAEDLTDDGYVEFSNGLLVQWGTSSGDRTTTTFPQAFTTLLTVTVSPTTQFSEWFINSSTTTGFQVDFNNGSQNFNWLALGVA